MMSKKHHFPWQTQRVYWSGELYEIYEARWWNTFLAQTMFFEIRALRLRHDLDIGRRALITTWYQDVDALRRQFDTNANWWAFRVAVCDDIGDYHLIGRSPPHDRLVFTGGGGIRLKRYAETFPGYRQIG